MLVKEPGTEKYVAIYGNSGTWYQHIETTAAEVVLEADRLRSFVSKSADKFGCCVRMSCLDGAKSNPRKEIELLILLVPEEDRVQV